MHKLDNYLSDFRQHFIKQGADQSGHIQYLIKGFIKCGKKKATCKGIEEKIDGIYSQAIHHTHSNSFWNPFVVMDFLLKRVWRHLSLHFEHHQIVLVIDEVGIRMFPKLFPTNPQNRDGIENQ